MDANLTAEQQKELAQFPPALRTLIEAELAAGNSVVEIGHSFPAPPAGAYFKFAKKVSTRPRASGDGLDFYEYNSSIYSGQFTDAKRFYFVIEPPNPPPPEPDMDAIRQQKSQGQDEALLRIEQQISPLARMAEDLKTISTRVFGSKSRKPSGSEPARPAKATAPTPTHSSASPVENTATSAAWLLHFRDARPPQEILAAMEYSIMKVFATSTQDGRLAYAAQAKINGAPYTFDLRFEAALPETNYYTLRIEVSWSAMPASSHDYFRKSAGSWIDFWTRSFKQCDPVAAGEGSAERYAGLCEAALQAEARLGSVPAIQQAIIAGMKRGATFSTAHKEGGTILKWADGCFIRSDYGDDPDLKKYADETEFLKCLRQFYDGETSRAVYPDKAPDGEVWKLILRKMSSR